jgi:hypothetical protein
MYPSPGQLLQQSSAASSGHLRVPARLRGPFWEVQRAHNFEKRVFWGEEKRLRQDPQATNNLEFSEAGFGPEGKCLLAGSTGRKEPYNIDVNVYIIV